MQGENGNQGAEDVTKALLDSDDINPRDLEGGEEDLTPVDPGSLEGKPKEDPSKKHEPKPGSERWNEVYGKKKELERENQTLKEQLSAKDKDIDLIRGQFTELLDVSKKNADAIKDLKETVAQPEEDPFDKEISRLDAEISDTKKAIKEARLALEDTDTLEDKLEQLREDKAVIRAKKDLAPPKKKEEAGKKEDPKPGDPPQIIKDFIKEAPWFDVMSPDFDEEMHYAAQGVEQKLLKDPEFAKKPEAERLAEVKKRTEQRFGWKPKGQQQADTKTGTNGQKRTHSMVEGGDGQSGGRGDQGQNGLTTEQKHVAHMLWPNMGPLDAEKQYAAGQRMVKGGR